MKTKFSIYCTFFITLLFLFTGSKAIAQEVHNASIRSLALSGLTASLQGPWAVGNSLSRAWPEDILTAGVSWINRFQSSQIQSLSCAIIRRFQQTALGLQINRTGYAISAYQSLHLSINQQLNSNSYAGIGYAHHWFRARGYRNDLERNVVRIGFTTDIKNKTWSTQVNFNPKYSEGRSLKIGVLEIINPKTSLMAEIGMKGNHGFNSAFGVQHQINPLIIGLIGIGTNPVKVSMGFKIITGHWLLTTGYQNQTPHNMYGSSIELTI